MGVDSWRMRIGTFSYRRCGNREEIIGVLNIEILFFIIFLVCSTHVMDLSVLEFLVPTCQPGN